MPAIRMLLLAATALASLAAGAVYSQTFPQSLAVGETGPGGGLVFYLEPSTIITGTNPPRGTAGIEAAPVDLVDPLDGDDFLPWGCLGIQTYANATAIGTGATNTAIIVANACSTAGNEAAEVAAAYSNNGFTDWFLPSNSELNQMYLNIAGGANEGGFAGDFYLSSSEHPTFRADEVAWGQRLDNGTGGYTGKNIAARTRAVRAFDLAGPRVLVDTNGANTALADGTIGGTEYENFSVGINSSFGGAAGQHSRIHVDSDLSGNLNLALERLNGALNDFVVVYLDTTAGGFSDTSSLTDTGAGTDGCRKAISGFDGSNRSTLSFPTGFEADFAICLEKNFAGLFSLNTTSHGLVVSGNLDCNASGTGCGDNSAAAYEFTITMSNLGLVAGDEFRYLSTSISGTGYRADEFHGVSQSTRPSGIGDIGSNPFTLNAGDFNTFISFAPGCSVATSLTGDDWAMIGLPCDLGVNTEVGDVFTVANGFVPEEIYDGSSGQWVVYERNYGGSAAGDNYRPMEIDDPMVPGAGYWVKFLGPGTTRNLDFVGARNPPPFNIMLQTDPNGRYNMIGHPHEFDVDWADVRVILPDATVLSLSEADPGGACQMAPPGAGCVLSSIMHKYDADSGVTDPYNALDGSIMAGTLQVGEGFWVSAIEPGITLQIPLIPSRASETGKKSASDRQPEGWQVELIATAGAMQTRRNFLGQLQNSVDQYDLADLPDMAPFNASYLTIVFPQNKWGGFNGDYSSDYREPNPGGDAYWQFEIRTSLPAGTQVTLSWEGPPRALDNAVLVDFEQKTKLLAGTGGTYTFTVTHPVRRFAWQQESWRH